MRTVPLLIPNAEVSRATASFDEVYRSHAATVARWVDRLGGPTIDRDDVFQEVFITVNRQLPQFRGESQLSTWLFRITAFVVANHRRSARRRRFWTRDSRPELEALTAPARLADESLEQREASRLVYGALDGLRERYRQVLVLFELEEMSTDDIARVLDCPPSTVRVWLHRARKEFSDRWCKLRRRQEEGK